MWFETHAGLFSTSEPLEVRIASFPKAAPPYRGVYVRATKNQDFQYKGIFGAAKPTGPSVWVARFQISDFSGRAIAESLELIEDANRADARVCDLSTAGDETAWPGWNLIGCNLRRSSSCQSCANLTGTLPVSFDRSSSLF